MTHSPFLLFEIPLKENIRSFLRLEFLFRKIRRCMKDDSVNSHLLALKLLFEVIEILERGDTRAELIKEHTRLLTLIRQWADLPDVDHSKLQYTEGQIEKLQKWLNRYPGKFSDRLRKDPLLAIFRHRIATPGGYSNFECPELHLFLESAAEQRQEQFVLWMDLIKGVPTSIDVILRFCRETGQWQQQEAPQGSYFIEHQERMPSLLRIRTKQDDKLFPEISSGKHRTVVHFMKLSAQQQKKPVKRPVSFEVALCY